MNIQTPLNAKFNVETPNGTITQQGAAEITARIYDAGHPTLSEDFDFVWLTNRGTLPKRVASYYHKQYGIKLNGDLLGDVGAIAKRHSSDGQSYTLDFTNRFDWCSGDYGDGGSCFWGDRSAARTMLESHDALAVRGYKTRRVFSHYDDNGERVTVDKESGYARAWLVRLNENLYVVFNGYGETALTFARLLSYYWGATYKKITLLNNGDDSGTLYINGGFGFAIGRPDLCEAIVRHDFGWEDNGDTVECYECGNEVSSEDTVTARISNTRSRTLCYECFFCCDDCGDNVSNSLRARNCDGNICDRCEGAHRESEVSI